LADGSVGDRARRAFGSLATRISVFVFAATLTSALAVALTSAHALRGFLRAKVEERVPEAVAKLRDRLDLWYAQRELDVQVFATSAIVVDGLAPLTGRPRAERGGRPGAEPRERAEVEQYLGYVLAGLPQYSEIFVLDAEGRVVLGVGPSPELDPDSLRALAAADATTTSTVLADRDGERFQVVTSPVLGRDGRPLATLHAVLPLRALEEQLAAAEAGLARVAALDERGNFVAGSETFAVEDGLRAALASLEPGAGHDAVTPDGVWVVASALALPRLRWTLVFAEDYDATFAPMASILGRTVTLNLGIVIVLSGLAFAAAARMLRPLHALSACALRLRDGEAGVELPVVATRDEVGILTRSFGEMVVSLTQANETLAQLAITDELTKIHNHRYFQEQLDKEIRRAERAGTPLALVLLDVDDFKGLNDRHGHVVGDGVLQHLAALLIGETRADDLTARYGGEEFAILAPMTGRDGAMLLGEKIRLAVASAAFDVPPATDPIAITISVGVSVYRGDRRAFIVEADRALYAAKDEGKDCVVAAD
jgi:diguanylate cyclase (GGDEF)-like protein